MDIDREIDYLLEGLIKFIKNDIQKTKEYNARGKQAQELIDKEASNVLNFAKKLISSNEYKALGKDIHFNPAKTKKDINWVKGGSDDVFIFGVNEKAEKSPLFKKFFNAVKNSIKNKDVFRFYFNDGDCGITIKRGE